MHATAVSSPYSAVQSLSESWLEGARACMSTNSTSAEIFQFASRNAEFGTYDLQAAAELLQSLRRLASSRRKELRRDKLNKLLIDESEEIARSDLLERKVADLRDSISVKNVSYKLLASAQKDSACPTWLRPHPRSTSKKSQSTPMRRPRRRTGMRRIRWMPDRRRKTSRMPTGRFSMLTCSHSSWRTWSASEITLQQLTGRDKIIRKALGRYCVGPAKVTRTHRASIDSHGTHTGSPGTGGSMTPPVMSFGDVSIRRV